MKLIQPTNTKPINIKQAQYGICYVCVESISSHFVSGCNYIFLPLNYEDDKMYCLNVTTDSGFIFPSLDEGSAKFKAIPKCTLELNG